jgi:hypothetical protein
MPSALVRIASLLTLSLMIPAVAVAQLTDSNPELEVTVSDDPGIDGEDASVRDAGAGGTSTHSSSAGIGGTKRGGGTREVDGPDMSSCTCRAPGAPRPGATGPGWLILTVAAVVWLRSRSRTRERRHLIA